MQRVCENYQVNMTWTFDHSDIPTRSSGSGAVRCSCSLLTPNPKKHIRASWPRNRPEACLPSCSFVSRLTNDLHLMCLWRHSQGDGVVASGLSVANVAVSPWWTGVANCMTIFRVFLLNVDQCGKTKSTHCFGLGTRAEVCGLL